MHSNMALLPPVDKLSRAIFGHHAWRAGPSYEPLHHCQHLCLHKQRSMQSIPLGIPEACHLKGARSVTIQNGFPIKPAHKLISLLFGSALPSLHCSACSNILLISWARLSPSLTQWVAVTRPGVQPSQRIVASPLHAVELTIHKFIAKVWDH